MNKKQKSITFILPGFITIPMGGVKVVNRLAELLSKRGHKVTLIYPLQLSTGIVYKTKKYLISLLDSLHKVKNNLYYKPDSSVSVIIVEKVNQQHIPKSDVVIAVGWQTAEAVLNLPEEQGEKFYFLQSFESYFNNSKKILQTYHYPMKKIAIAQWILNELNKIHESGYGPIGNAINRKEFYDMKSEFRPFDVMMIYHPAKIKSPTFGIKVLKRLKKLNPNFQAVIVAPRKPIHKIPEWIQLHIRPDIIDLRKIYNSSKIYFHPSIWEGWGLPPMEAIACGCAIVSVENHGVSEYLTHQKNALLISKNINHAIENISQLLLNTETRKKMVKLSQEILDNYCENKITLYFENLLFNT